MFLNYIFSWFRLEIVNIVLHVKLFQPFEYQGLIIHLSELLSRQGHTTSCPKPSDLLDIKLFHFIKKDCSSGTKDIYIPPLSCFINKHYDVWKLAFDHQAKIHKKLKYKVKRVYNIELYSKQSFTCLERTCTFITSTFRIIYRSSSPEVFSKKGVPLQICSIFRIPMQKCDFNITEVTLLHGCSPVNCLNILRTPFLKNTSVWLLL